MTDVQGLVAEFAEAVAAQARVMLLDAEKGNEHARRYIAAFESLRQRGDEGRDALATLFADARPEVRVMAASYLLRHRGQVARRVLEAEAAGRRLTAFAAAQALKRWEEGTWNLDPAVG
jgi:hypothetical protein